MFKIYTTLNVVHQKVQNFILDAGQKRGGLGCALLASTGVEVRSLDGCVLGARRVW